MTQLVLIFLRIYLVAVVVFMVADEAKEQRRHADFARWQDCCQTANEQYEEFAELAKTMGPLEERLESGTATRLERFQSVSAWGSAITSYARNSPNDRWGYPGIAAVGELTTLLGNHKITPIQVVLLADIYAHAGPDADPPLATSMDRASGYLVNNVGQLRRVVITARDDMHSLLLKEAGSEERLAEYSASAKRAVEEARGAEQCTTSGLVSASALHFGKKDRPPQVGVLTCLRRLI